jgi:hypothetical protein
MAAKAGRTEKVVAANDTDFVTSGCFAEGKTPERA